MKLSLFLFAAPALAFFPYIPPGHPGAPRKVHSVGESISRGFGFLEKENVDQQALLGKATLKKRAVKNTRLAKRLNDFKVETDNTPTQKQSAAIDQDGTDFSYFAEVQIGSNSVYMLLDSGSSALWVMGTDCSSDACHSHQLSSSDNTTDDQFSLSYNSGTVSGVLASEQMQFAGMTLDVTIGLASETSDDFSKYPMDGILGLARSASGTDFNANTFIQNVQSAGALPANIFGVWLDRAGDNKNGEINFGAPDTTRFQGDLNYLDTDMSDLNVWKIPVGDVLVNGDSSNLGGRAAIIDTGTTYMFVPPSDADAIFKNVEGATLPGGSDMYNIPCDTTANISVVFNNVAYEISPKDYVGATVSDGTCYTHIIGMAAAGDDSTWLLGDTFLKNVYTVFDADQNRIGFGLPAENAESSDTTGSAPASATGSAMMSATSDPATGMVGGGSGSSGGPTTNQGSSTGSTGSTGSGSNHGSIGTTGGSGAPGNKDDQDAMDTIGAAAGLSSSRAGLVAGIVAAIVATLV